MKKFANKKAFHVKELEEKLKERFNHLNNVIIVNCRGSNIKEEIAKAAAGVIRKLNIEPGSSIAVSCGTNVMEVAKNLAIDPGNIKKVKIYPLVVTMGAEMEEVSPAGIVSYLAQVLPNSVGYAAQFPKIFKIIDLAKDKKTIYEEDVKFLLDESSNAKYMFTGIGKISSEEKVSCTFNQLIKDLELMDELDNLKAIGDFCYQPFTIEGNFLMNRKELRLLKSNVIYVDSDVLKERVKKSNKGKDNVEIFSIAGGREKHESIVGALKSKVFNNLVTDIETAEYIDRYLFSLDSDYRKYLQEGPVDDTLTTILEYNKLVISNKAEIIKEDDKHWRIEDCNKTYKIEDTGMHLNVFNNPVTDIETVE